MRDTGHVGIFILIVSSPMQRARSAGNGGVAQVTFQFVAQNVLLWRMTGGLRPCRAVKFVPDGCFLRLNLRRHSRSLSWWCCHACIDHCCVPVAYHSMYWSVSCLVRWRRSSPSNTTNLNRGSTIVAMQSSTSLNLSASRHGSSARRTSRPPSVDCSRCFR